VPTQCRPRARHRFRPRRDRYRSAEGSITAETAVVLPALALVVVVLFGVARAVGGQLAVEDAARVGARAAARGETTAEIERLTASVAPPGAAVTVSRVGGLVRVEVSAQVPPLGATARFVPDLSVRARAVASDESVAATGAEP
jgi:Flp pilus assembly protein TadG